MATFILGFPRTGSSVDPDQWLFTLLVEVVAALAALFGVMLVVLPMARPSPVRRPAPSPGSSASGGMGPPETPSRPQEPRELETGGRSDDLTSEPKQR